MFKVLSALLCLVILCSTSVPSVFAVEKNPNPITIYYPNGDWEYVPVELSFDEYDNRFLSALNLLVSGYNLPHGCYDEFPEGVKINKYEIKGKTAYVDVSKLLVNEMSSKGLSTDVVRDILSYNVFNFDNNIQNICFSFDGKTVENFSIVSRDDFFKIEPQDDREKKVNEKLEMLKEQLKKGKTPDEIRELVKKAIRERQSDASKTVSALATYKVCIDPGHGGTDSGAVGTYNGTTYYEKNFNLSIGNYLKTYLESDGISVVMTRTTDTNVDLTTRYTIANNNNVNCFVSVHINSSTNTSARGTTCIYPNNHHITESSELANEVHNAVISNTSLPQHRVPYKDERNLAVLRNTKMPAIITETGFMSNNIDLAYLRTALNREAVASAIELGIYWWLYW